MDGKIWLCFPLKVIADKSPLGEVDVCIECVWSEKAQVVITFF